MSFLKSVLSCFVLLFITSTTFAASPFVKGELLVQLTVKASKANASKAIKEIDGEVLEDLPQIRVKRIRVPEKNFDKVKAALSKNPNFVFVEENFLAQGMIIPNDPSFSSQWHHTKIMAPSAWEMGVGSTSMPIAIIDSGVDPDHPDLDAKLHPGYNFLFNNTDTHDVLGHGTAVAGSATASSNNGTGVTGVAWHNPIMPLVVLDSSNWATYSNISSAIIYAVNNGAKVINISIGGTSFSSTLDSAVNYAWDNGALVFASAANYNVSTPYYPAACANAVAVAATDSADNKASFSNYGDWITLSAPGVSILTTTNGGGYGYWNGTSFSSPISAGLAALIWSVNPQLTHQQVLDILKSTTDDLGASGFDSVFGHGRINAYNAVMEAMNFLPDLDVEPPSVALTSPENNQTFSGDISITATAQDNVAVEKVEFFLDGSLYATDATAPFATTWDVSAVPDGSYTIDAVAFDAAGNSSLPDSVQVFVEEPVVEEPVAEEPVAEEPVVEEPVAEEPVDDVPPLVTIDSPSSGSIEDRVTVLATASDASGVVEMTVYINGEVQKAQATDSIRWNWNTRKMKSGTYLLRVEAKDPAGNVGFEEMVLSK